jgi:nucleotide-binding universal stress UspA family protein
MYKRILVPTDGSDITSKAVQTAINLAKVTGASLVSVSVKEPFPYSAISEMQPVPPQEFYDAQERIAAERVKAVVNQANAANLNCDGYTVEALHPWEAIIDQAKQQDCDLIVMASHGRRGVTALLLGSETNRVLTHSHLPVLVVK